MKAQQVLVQRVLDWDQVHKRLKKFPNIGAHYGENILRSCSHKPPYYCHYLAWRLGTWHNETLFEFFDRLLAVAAKLPNWKREFNSFRNSCDFGEYWSLLWQLQVGHFFASREKFVKWNVTGPDLEVVTDQGPLFIECYSYRKSFAIKEFIQELFFHLGLGYRIDVTHRSYIRFYLPQDRNRDDFLHELFSPYLDKAFIGEKCREAQKVYPVPLPVPNGAKNFHVLMEGNNIKNYDPARYENYAGCPEGYLSEAIKEGVKNKRNSNQLKHYRPNVLAINYLLSSDFQTARDRQERLGTQPPKIDFGTELDAVLIAACGIDQELLSQIEVFIGEKPHLILDWLKKHGFINSG